VEAQHAATLHSRGHIRAQIAHPRASASKNTVKIVELMVKNDGQWRFFEDRTRHFGVLRADGDRLQHARRLDLTFKGSDCLARRLARQIGRWAPTFTDPVILIDAVDDKLCHLRDVSTGPDRERPSHRGPATDRRRGSRVHRAVPEPKVSGIDRARPTGTSKRHQHVGPRRQARAGSWVTPSDRGSMAPWVDFYRARGTE
jgi:hypothetical protein